MAKNDGLVWNYFRSKGLTEAGTAGLMGNLEAESGIRSDRKQGDVPYSQKSVNYTNDIIAGRVNMVNGSIGYGIAQWTSSNRQQNLYNFMTSRGLRIDDLEGQVAFLYSELSSSYRSVLSVLTTTNNIQEASNIVLTQFEVPEDQGSSVKRARYNLSATFYQKYSGKAVESVYEDNLFGNGYNTEDSSNNISLSTILKYYETLPDLDSQPYYAFVDLCFDGYTLPAVPSDYLQNLTVQDINDGGGTNINLTLLDRYGDEIEEMLYRTADSDNYIRFGHISGRQSKLLHFRVVEYNLQFEPVGTILTISGFSNTAYENLKTVTYSSGTNPSDCVKTICDKLNLQYTDETIHKTSPVTTVDGSIKEFNLINDNQIDYINKEIAPYATRESDGLGGYQFYIDEDTEPPTAYFKPVEYTDNVTRTYIHMKGLNTNVISFDISSNFVVSGEGALKITSALEGTVLNNITKEESTYTSDINVRDEVTGTYSFINSSQSSNVVNTAGMSYGEAVSSLNYRMRLSHNAYSGTLTIVGDPTIKINDVIRIIVITRKNYMHHTSGIYKITGVTHTISSGIMITSLEVVKGESFTGGIELSYYKRKYK